jgi:hypothetical protein
MWPYLIVLIIATVVARALTPKPEPPKPASLEDFQAPTAEEGRAIPVIFGTVWLNAPNVTWYGDLRSTPIRKSGGKK